MLPKFSFKVGLHLLTILFDGRFAIIKRHHYYLGDKSNSVNQTISNGVGKVPSTRTIDESAPTMVITKIIEYHSKIRYIHL